MASLNTLTTTPLTDSDFKKLLKAYNSSVSSSVDVHKQYIAPYIDACNKYSNAVKPPKVHHRFCDLVDRMRRVYYQADFSEVAASELKNSAQRLIDEVASRTQQIGMSVLRREAEPDAFEYGSVIKTATNIFVDTDQGLVVQRWPNRKACQRYTKCLITALNAHLAVFHVPAFAMVECCGHCFLGISMAPVSSRHENLHKNPEMMYYLEAVACNAHIQPQPKALKSEVAVAFGSDARWYMLDARGLFPPLRMEAADIYEGDPNPTELENFMEETVSERCADDILAFVQTESRPTSSILHSYGINVNRLHTVNAVLSQKEKRAHDASPLRYDKEAAEARRTLVTEMFARVCKLIIRELWMSKIDVARNYNEAISEVQAEQSGNAGEEDGGGGQAARSRRGTTAKVGFAPAGKVAWDNSISAFPTDLEPEHLIQRRFIQKTVLQMTKLANWVLGSTIDREGDFLEDYPSTFAIFQSATKKFFDDNGDSKMKTVSWQLVETKLLVTRLSYLLLLQKGSSGRSFVSAKHRTVRGSTLYVPRVFSSSRGGQFKKAMMKAVRGVRTAYSYSPWRRIHLLFQLADLYFLVGKERAKHVPETILDQVKTHLGEDEDPRDAQQLGLLVDPEDPTVELVDYDKLRRAVMYGSYAQNTKSYVDILNAFMAMSLERTKGLADGEPGYAGLALSQRVMTICVVVEKNIPGVRTEVWLDMCFSALSAFQNQNQINSHQAAWLWIATFSSHASTLVKEGKHMKALEVTRRKREFFVDMFGEGSKFVAQASNDLGILYAQMGDLENAREEFHQCIDTFNVLSPSRVSFTSKGGNPLNIDGLSYREKDPAYCAACNNLAFIYFNDAETIAREAGGKNLRTKYLKPKLPPAAEAAAHKAKELLEILVAARDCLEQQLLIDVYNNLGSIDVMLGSYYSAERYFHASLDCTAGVVADTHPDRAVPLSNIKQLSKRRKIMCALRIQSYFRQFKAKRAMRQRREAQGRIAAIGMGALERVKLAIILNGGKKIGTITQRAKQAMNAAVPSAVKLNEPAAKSQPPPVAAPEASQQEQLKLSSFDMDDDDDYL